MYRIEIPRKIQETSYEDGLTEEIYDNGDIYTTYIDENDEVTTKRSKLSQEKILKLMKNIEDQFNALHAKSKATTGL